jgi:acetyltransferase-like isoleucine patch superfamily enzyme
MKSKVAGTVRGGDFFAHAQALVESREIGSGTRIWPFAHVMAGARIGRDCNIGDHAFVESGASLGNNVTVKNGVSIWDRVTIEDNVFLGPNCVLTNDPNARAYLKKVSSALQPTLIRESATIGANATLLCGITIGKYAFIGAGAVVTRSVRDFALLVGNPARQVGWMCACARKLSLAASTPVGSTCTCAYCRRTFRCGPEGLCLQDSDSRDDNQ